VAPETTPRRRPLPAAQAARYFGALMLLGTGAIHLQQYFAVYYQVIPVIGPLFAANFAMAVVLGVSLLAPAERMFPAGRPLLALAALGGIGFAVGTLVGLELSEFGTLFGFHEHGYRTLIILSIAFEGAAIVSLAAYLAQLGRSRTTAARHATPSITLNPS
jgi:hypothetical protein